MYPCPVSPIIFYKILQYRNQDIDSDSIYQSNLDFPSFTSIHSRSILKCYMIFTA